MKTKTLRWLAAMLLLVSAMVIPARGNAQVKLTYVSSSSGFNGETADNLFDGKTSTKWCGPCKDSPAYVIFQASKPCWLYGYTITTADDNTTYHGRNPKDWIIYGSNDRNTWTELVVVSSDEKLQPVNFTPFKYTLANAIADSYIYYKWEITATKGDINVQASEFSISVSDYAVDWSTIEWATDATAEGALKYKYKVAIPNNDIELVNIQKMNGDSKVGIYINFKTSSWGNIRINGEETTNYKRDGAGVCLYLSNFTEEWTEVQVMDPNNSETTKWTLYVYYVKPEMVSASKAYVTLNTAVLNVAGTDNGIGAPATRFKVVYGETEKIYTATNGQITITGLEPSTTYSFDIYAVDAVGKVSDNKIPVSVKTLMSHPAAPAAPIHDQDKVFSIYSETYTSKVTRVFGSWGQTTVEEGEATLADGRSKAFYYTNCNYLGWELNDNNTIGNMSLFPHLHMDIYVPEACSIQFSPVCWVDKGAGTKKEVLKVYNLKKGWNALDIDLTEDFATNDLKNIFQLKWDALPAVCYIDNVYFWAEAFIIYHYDDMPAEHDPVAVTKFTGETISYPIKYKRKLIPGKWETLCLPFTVDSITVYDPQDKKNYKLYAQYRNGQDVTAGDFWLRQFVNSSVTAGAAFQDNWKDIEADSQEKALPKKGVPYIIRVPGGGYYNEKYIVFHGAGNQTIAKTNETPRVPADGYFSYSGNQTMKDWNLQRAYVLNVEREAFEAADPNGSVTVHPFECAVNATQATILRSPRLMISSPQITTADGLPSTEYEGGRIYTTMGVLVGTFETLDEEENCVMHLPEGIYIVQRRQAISKIQISK